MVATYILTIYDHIIVHDSGGVTGTIQATCIFSTPEYIFVCHPRTGTTVKVERRGCGTGGSYEEDAPLGMHEPFDVAETNWQ